VVHQADSIEESIFEGHKAPSAKSLGLFTHERLLDQSLDRSRVHTREQAAYHVWYRWVHNKATVSEVVQKPPSATVSDRRGI
jgi:hypothetical protein